MREHVMPPGVAMQSPEGIQAVLKESQVCTNKDHEASPVVRAWKIWTNLTEQMTQTPKRRYINLGGILVLNFSP